MLTLSNEEIRGLTGCARRADQEAWLLSNGVPFRKDGERILVATTNAERWLSGHNMPKLSEPNLAAAR